MNDKIQELKTQAMLFAQEKCQGQSRDANGTLRADIMTAKFAELVWAAARQQGYDEGWSAGEAAGYNSGYSDGIATACES